MTLEQVIDEIKKKIGMEKIIQSVEHASMEVEDTYSNFYYMSLGREDTLHDILNLLEKVGK